MRILMLTPYLPYPDSSGGQIRTQNLLKHLKKDHEITLFALIKSPEEKKYIPILEEKFCHKVKVFYRPPRPWMLSNILKTGFSANPFVVVRNFSTEAKKAIEKELHTGSYDLIHAETFYAMPHIPKTDLPVVLVDQTIEYKVYDHYVRHSAPLFLKPILSIDVAKLKNRERFYWRQATRVIAVSKDDRAEMLAVEPNLKVDIVPNGVNMDFFKPKKNWSDPHPKILFVGNFNWMQNTEAAHLLIDQVFPLVKKEVPNAILHIVGQHQPISLLSRQREDIIIDKLSENDAQTIAKANFEASVSATPLRGPGGTRLKILGAMASKLPIVSSTVGVSGLGVTDGVEAFVRDDPSRMAQAIIQLIKDPALAKKVANNAYRFVVENYDYARIAKHLSGIYQEIASK